MVTTETLEVTLGASGSKEVLIWAACADLNLDEPSWGDPYRVRSATPYPGLVPILKALEDQGVSRDTYQAAVWIFTDNADWSDLGHLVSSGARSIDADEAATAMRAVDQNGMTITTRAIWSDRGTILAGVTDATLRSWLQSRG